MGLKTVCFDTINTSMVVVLFLYLCIWYFDSVIRLGDHQCLKNQVKSPSIVSRPLRPPRPGMGGGCDIRWWAR